MKRRLFLLIFIILNSAYAQTLECDLTIQFPNFKHNKESMLKALAINGLAFKFGNDTVKRDPEIVLAAVEKNGYVLSFADSSIYGNREIVLTAVRNYGEALE